MRSHISPGPTIPYKTLPYSSIEFDEFLEFIIARQGDGRDVHNEIVQVSAYDSILFLLLFNKGGLFIH